MAINTGREFLVGPADVRRVDAGREAIIDPAMALGTGGGDVGPVHGGAGVPPGQFAVGGVAIDAIRGNGEAGFQQSFAVDAFGVVLQNVGLGAVIANGSLLAGTVTLRAEARNVAGVAGRVGLCLAQDAVGPVAIAADRSVGATLAGQLTVRALLVLGDYLGVADGAIDLLDDSGTGTLAGRRHARVALDTGDPCVAGGSEFWRLDEKGDGAAAAFDLQVGIAVAALAITIRHALRIEDSADFMGLVAIDAGGDDVGLFLPEFAADHLLVDSLDLGMAFGTGLCNVLLGDG